MTATYTKIPTTIQQKNEDFPKLTPIAPHVFAGQNTYQRN